MEESKVLLEHAVINQLEQDFEDQEYDALSEMLGLLMEDERSAGILTEYLSDELKEQFLEGKVTIRY